MTSNKCPVVVPVVDVKNSPAVAALIAEGVDPIWVVMHDEFAYGELITDLWNRGTGFVLIEHDIAPWPGAIAELQACNGYPVCGFPYWHLTDKGVEYKHSLGMIKVSGRFTKKQPLPEGFDITPWRNIVHRFWFEVYPHHHVHIHKPGVAHARGS